MPDAFDQLDREFLEDARAGISALALHVNELLEPRVRRKTGQLRRSIMGNWDVGMTGGTFKPPKGLDPHPIPNGDDIREAVRRWVPGDGLSTRSLVGHSFWLDQDQTLEEVAALAEGVELS